MIDSGHHKNRKRGRHKRATSLEAKRWNDEYLIPERPVWMPVETYVKLAEMRNA